LDLRVLDPGWAAKKLRSISNLPEPQGDFLARIPGEQKQANQPSTVAYVARLILHRFHMLGLLDRNGYPVNEMGIFKKEEQVTGNKAGLKLMPGKNCQACGVNAVIKKDGCDFCTACGEVGSCG
jgi:ribonucleoside-diphosphate reductase alpha chain